MNLPDFRGYCRRHHAALAALVLGLAAFNLTYRLDREFVTEWDESLYAMSAWEMADSGDWVGVRMFGNLDYSNTKPPLNVWLITLAFKAFGRGLVSLRLASVVSAWLTILALMVWARRRYDRSVALAAGTILATTFGFLHVHSGRTANTDALFTLLVLLVVIALSAEERHPWKRLYVGPLLAAAFLLRGMGVLLPLAIVVVVDVWTRRFERQRLMWSAAAVLLGLMPVAAWGWARYRLDGFMFLERLFNYDFVARSVQALDGHAGGPLYYLNILVKHQYEWLAVCVAAVLLCPLTLSNVRSASWFDRGHRSSSVLITAWALCTVLIPTVMATKTPWYLTTFYPLFALGVARVLVLAFRQLLTMPNATARIVSLAAITVVMFGIAEAKLWVYSANYRDLTTSAQGLLLDERARLAGRDVYRDRFDRSTTFVAGLVGIRLRTASSFDELLHTTHVGDYLLVTAPTMVPHRRLVVIRSNNGNWLLLRRPHAGVSHRFRPKR